MSKETREELDAKLSKWSERICIGIFLLVILMAAMEDLSNRPTPSTKLPPVQTKSDTGIYKI